MSSPRSGALVGPWTSHLTSQVQYVGTELDTLKTFPVLTSCEFKLNLQALPKSDSSILHEMGKGQHVEESGHCSGWFNQQGYSIVSDLQTKI